ncbi:MAG: sodium-translocating pyrophosphatase [Candidatus Hydrogenedentota bacterium]
MDVALIVAVSLSGVAIGAALLFVLYLISYVLKQPQGTEHMALLSRRVQQGAAAFLKKEYTYVGSFIVVIMLILAVIGIIDPDFGLNWKTAVAFFMGALASACAGVLGMSIATRANARTTAAAESGGVKAALDVAISGGAVMGLGVVGIALFGLVVVWLVFRDPVIVNGYAMGASLVALFGRSGGGIFTKGADMGADLVGKVEAGIPEDDPRNPAVIADNVGDNVGDVAGLGADLLESFVASIIASLAIATMITVAATGEASTYATAFPFMTAAVGIIASIIGVLYVKKYAQDNPQKALMMGTYLSALLAVLGVLVYGAVGGSEFELNGVVYQWWGPVAATIIGIIAGSVVGFVSEYFTSTAYNPVKKLAERCQTGPATAVVEGTAVGMESTWGPALVLAVAIIAAFSVAGLYGVALAALGMLATTGMVVAVDSYGPIADNAGGIAEMAHLDPKVREITDNLDAVGNTTAAIGKGFAIGSAAFAAIGLLSAFMLASGLTMGPGVSLDDPQILAGLLIGAMIPFFFSSMLFRAVGSCADTMIMEVRRQFKEIPGLREGEEGVEPDSTRCVAIATDGAIKGMLFPGGLAIVLPVIIGFALGAEGLAGMLVGSIATGVMLGLQTANSGGAMDNAKKYIEEGHYGGKGSEAHKAAVVGDTVGDPLKDTVGPSINILIKLMSVISLVLAPLFYVTYASADQFAAYPNVPEEIVQEAVETDQLALFDEEWVVVHHDNGALEVTAYETLNVARDALKGYLDDAETGSVQLFHKAKPVAWDVDLTLIGTVE